jgi:phosphoribosyl-ATP pyrophosphohydrolase
VSWAYYENSIDAWGHDRGIIQNGKPMGQAIKTLEETTELIDAINKGDKDAIKDAVGDIFVTLLMQCAIQGFTATEALATAYDVIKSRKGFLTPEGIFVKQ